MARDGDELPGGKFLDACARALLNLSKWFDAMMEDGRESSERRAAKAEYAILLYAPVRWYEANEENEENEENEVVEEDDGAGRAEHDQHADDLQSDGTMVAAFALEPYTTSTSIRGDVITDGPFLKTKEVIAGFCIIHAPDLDGALEIARRNPICHQGGGVEVRPVEGWVIPERLVREPEHEH